MIVGIDIGFEAAHFDAIAEGPINRREMAARHLAFVPVDFPEGLTKRFSRRDFEDLLVLDQKKLL